MYGERGTRLLTSTEYFQSLRDILGDLKPYLDDRSLPTDLKVSTFINQKNHSVDSISIRKYWSLAQVIAAWAIENKLPFDCATQNDCATTFINNFAYKLYRRPLTETEVASYRNIFDQLPGNDGLEAALITALGSPQFLYRSELGISVADALREPRPATPESDYVKRLKRAAPNAYILTPYEFATSLSYTLTGTTPDDALLTAAKNGELEWDANVLKQINRLLDSPHGQRQTGSFAGQWFNTDYVIKMPSIFPESPQSDLMHGYLAEEVRRLFSAVFYDPTAALGQFYAADFALLNTDLAYYYKVNGPSDFTWAKVPRVYRRGGLFTTGAFNIVNATADTTDFTARAISVRERALCQQVDGTNTQYTVDALAKGLGDFNERGLWSNTGSKPGTLYGLDNVNDITTKLEFTGSQDLGKKIANLPAVQRCFINTALHYIEAPAPATNRVIDPIIAAEKQHNLACSKTQAEAVFNSKNKNPRAVFTHFISQDFIRFRK